MGRNFGVKLTISIVMILSLYGLPNQMANYHLPSVQFAKGNQAPVENWYPSGPAMDYEVSSIFVDESSEFNALVSSTIDLTDTPLSSLQVPDFSGRPGLYVTSPVEGGFSEIEFNLVNTFWNCEFHYGNSSEPSCAKDIRQGIAHLIDKNQFSTTQANIQGQAVPIDNPVPPNEGLPSANPCGWDQLFPETGPSCIVGSSGGLAYHLAAATGGSHGLNPWQPYLGDRDFCAAADHFMRASLGTGKDHNTCVLKGIPTVQKTVNIFVRTDNQALNDLGNSLAQEICALFTGQFTKGCSPYVTVTEGLVGAFPGFTTNGYSTNKNWWIYVAGPGSFTPIQPFEDLLARAREDPFDASLYFTYNSRFAAGGSFDSPPCASTTLNLVPSNYIWLCNSSYDDKSKQMEYAPCLSASGDPTPGQTVPTFANCPNTTSNSAISAGYQAEVIFGNGAYTIPVWTGKHSYAYLSNWQSVVNSPAGIPNFFTWLNAYSSRPLQSGTIIQALKQPTTRLNPYYASTPWDFMILGNIYDSLGGPNPVSNGQYLDWMTTNHQQLDNSAVGYTPPPGTQTTYRFNLRNDLYWHDGRPVTSWDVQYSYLTLQATGAIQGALLAPVLDVHIMNPHQFDINLDSSGPFTLSSITAVAVIPGRYWSGTCPGTTWDNDVAQGAVPTGCMKADQIKIALTYDPLKNGILIGSGPWLCESNTGVRGTGCSSTGDQTPGLGGSFTLQRYGLGHAPGASLVDMYFRSNGNLALWAWSGNNGDFTHDFINFSVVSRCVGQPTKPLGDTSGCGHWQQGIGGIVNGQPTKVDTPQVGIVSRFVGVNWVQPYEWSTSPPAGIASYPPVLYEGQSTLNPANIAGCTSGYPVGGYDC